MAVEAAVASGRNRDVVELVAWLAAAPLLPLAGFQAILAGLAWTYGSLEAVPPEVGGLLGYVSPVFPLILGVLAWLRLRGEGLRGAFGRARGDLRTASVVALTLLGLTMASLSLFAALAPASVPPLGAMPPSMHLYYGTVGALIPGIGEELFFRGLVTRLGRGRPTWVLALLSGVAFSAWHLTAPAYLAHTFVMGVALLLLTQRCGGRLFPAMLAHTLANAGMGVVLGTGLWSP